MKSSPQSREAVLWDIAIFIWFDYPKSKYLDHNSLEHCVLTKPVPSFVRNGLGDLQHRAADPSTRQDQTNDNAT
jgi:hypothetical protein